jgi:hypothetical protein
MAFNETNAQRIREILQQKSVDFFEKKMFGGVCFMVDEKMCCGTRMDKTTNEDLLLCRIGGEVYAAVLKNDNVIPLENKGKAMKSLFFVNEAGHRNYKDLADWLQLCIDYNPLAKSSRK